MFGGAVPDFAEGVVLLFWANTIDVVILFFEVNDFILVSNQFFITFLIEVLFIELGRQISHMHSPDLHI